MSGGIKKWLTHDPDDRPGERALVRLLVPAAFIVSGVTAYLISHHTKTAPGIAFGNHLIFAGLLFLTLFYGVLLMALPLLRALFAGELPIELTTKGPRYPEKELESSRAAAEDLGKRLDAVDGTLTASIEDTAASAAQGLDDLEREVQAMREDLERLSTRPARRRFLGFG